MLWSKRRSRFTPTLQEVTHKVAAKLMISEQSVMFKCIGLKTPSCGFWSYITMCCLVRVTKWSRTSYLISRFTTNKSWYDSLISFIRFPKSVFGHLTRAGKKKNICVIHYSCRTHAPTEFVNRSFSPGGRPCKQRSLVYFSCWLASVSVLLVCKALVRVSWL